MVSVACDNLKQREKGQAPPQPYCRRVRPPPGGTGESEIRPDLRVQVHSSAWLIR